MEPLEHPVQQHETPTLIDKVSRWVYRRRWAALFVFLPTLLTAIYCLFIASDIYISESRFVIKAPNQKQAQLSSLANLIQTTGLSGGQEQTNEVLGYVRSRSALSDLSRLTEVRGRFTSPEVDLLSRYPGPFLNDRFENLYKYYGKVVGADLDPETGMAVLKVKAFTPDDAYALNARLLDLSEALVNKLNNRSQSKAILEAERRVRESEQRLRQTRIALRQYRNDVALIDPAKQAVGVLDVSNRLISEQAALSAQLESMQRMAPRNPSIPALRNRIAAIGRQIGSQNSRVVGTDSGIASRLTEYENLSVEQDFATQVVTAANASLEQARADAQKQQFYLERVVEPNRPDAPLLPRRLLQVLVVFATSVCLYLIGWMLIVGILEHAPEG